MTELDIKPLAAALVVLAASAGPVRATSCDHEVVARIVMAPGAACWRYRGTATTFTGAFARRQHVVARMTGEAAEFDPRTGRTRVSIQPRDPSASGPAKFFVFGANGDLVFSTPLAGTYRFGFSPCAMWGGRGTVEICAR